MQNRNEVKSTHAMTTVMLQAQPMVRALSFCYPHPETGLQTQADPDSFPVDKRAVAYQAILNNLPNTGHSEAIHYNRGDIDYSDEVQQVRDLKSNRY